jgi:hypothetical protein
MRDHMMYDKNASPLQKFKAIKRLVRQNFTPHGICAGSEHQGGKHESSHSNASIQPGRAVNFVTTMTVDGKNEDLVNYWYKHDLCAGDTLLFTLEQKLGSDINDREYHLTRYYKQPVRRSIRMQPDSVCWQLVPHVHRVKDPLPPLAENIQYDYRIAGYWRIAQTFQCRRLSHSDRGQTAGPLLEVTFAPVWMDFSFCKKRKETKKRAHSPVSSNDDSSSVSTAGKSANWSAPSESGDARVGKKLKFPKKPP